MHSNNRPSATDDLYARLQVERNSSLDEIKSAYRARAKEWHPDTCTNLEEKIICQGEFVAIGEAYEILSDESKRKIYNSNGSAESYASTHPDEDSFNHYWEFSAEVLGDLLDDMAKSDNPKLRTYAMMAKLFFP